MGRTLALTDYQLHRVQAASRAILGLHRQDWLNAVTDELMRCQDSITDTDVSTAIQRVSERYFSGVKSC
jgi:hypothetical protein